MTDRNRIADCIRAGFGGLYLLTREEVRAEAQLREVAGALGYRLHAWSVTEGLIDLDGGRTEAVTDPVEAACLLRTLPEKSILLLRDFHQFMGDAQQPASPLVTRTLKETVREARTSSRVLIVSGCVLQLPPELEKELTVIEFGLPDRTLLRTVAGAIAGSAEIAVDGAVLDAASEAAAGLTTSEVEDIMALSVVATGGLDAPFIAARKAEALAKGGILELSEPAETLEHVGGLAALKQWLLRRRHAFTDDARAFGLPSPRGVLILGIPGTGKSLTAKAASSALGLPLLRLDAGRLFAGIVGQSEANLRRALATAEAVAPCILWCDELEKALSGSRSSGVTDGGTGARVFGGFLSWMQERTSPVFVVATANDISQLPPELLRRGRMDEIFFVDLPDEAERRRIWEIHIGARDRDPAGFDLAALAELSRGFTGSEIEQAVIDALFTCFDAGNDLTDEALTDAVVRTVPLSTTMAEQIRALRDWASNRARSASGRDGSDGERTRRIAA